MNFIGFSTSIRPEEDYIKCPEFWDKEYAQKYARLWNFRIAAETVEMDYEDMTLFWVYGEQKDPANGFDNE